MSLNCRTLHETPPAMYSTYIRWETLSSDSFEGLMPIRPGLCNVEPRGAMVNTDPCGLKLVVPSSTGELSFLDVGIYCFKWLHPPATVTGHLHKTWQNFPLIGIFSLFQQTASVYSDYHVEMLVIEQFIKIISALSWQVCNYICFCVHELPPWSAPLQH